MATDDITLSFPDGPFLFQTRRCPVDGQNIVEMYVRIDTRGEDVGVEIFENETSHLRGIVNTLNKEEVFWYFSLRLPFGTGNLRARLTKDEGKTFKLYNLAFRQLIPFLPLG